MATIIGTSASDILTGTEFDDIIKGRGDSDYLIGLAGVDLLIGGTATICWKAAPTMTRWLEATALTS